MDWEVLIPILFFALPVAISILDKRARKRKGIPSVQARPVIDPAAASVPGTHPGKRPAAQDPSQPDGWAPPSYEAEGGYGFPGRVPERQQPKVAAVFRGDLPVSNQPQPEAQPPAEGQRAIHREEKKKAQEDGQKKLEIDKKKLILYSEILKPKFDA